jgi:hypothetical protein
MMGHHFYVILLYTKSLAESKNLEKCYRDFNCKEVLSKERKRYLGVSKVNKIFDGMKLLTNIGIMYFKKYEKK